MKQKFAFIFSILAFCYSIASSETITDKTYLDYEVRLQEILYAYAQDPETLQTQFQKLNEKFDPSSIEWNTYMKKLSQEKEKILRLNQEVQEQLREKGIGYGNLR